MALSPLILILAACFGVCVLILLLLFVLMPVCKGIGFLLTHIFSFIGGMITDSLRFVGAMLAMIVLAPLAPINVVIGRWSAASHFVASVKRECKVALGCLYRIALQRPLRLVFLGSLLEGLEQRVPEAMADAPTRDKPSKNRSGQFEGYRIVGSLKGGGSGGKLYIAEPSASLQGGRKAMPDRVVIKSFALSEGSSLPQIVRESRALEAARQLGLVLDHSMSDQHFYYVMPYHPGDHLGIITRQLHAEAGEHGLTKRQLGKVQQYITDLVATLTTYHDGGLWHKDIKPENVIVHDNRAHVVDLGLVTPLRSAMTLTTHGTEYFRDPEMVRQALRGVKVHQIDCTKFDIYAAGAVLYFMLENTFPAHGGLSKFHRNSPESLRWIVRRAMSEYNKRYDNAEAMLADLAVVMEARDPFTVRPADLPSMGGSAVPLPEMPADTLHSGIDHQLAPDHDEVDAAVDYRGHRRAPVGAAFAGAGAAVGAVAGAANAAFQRTRPRLQVMNWWTGAYRVDDDGIRPGPMADMAGVAVAPIAPLAGVANVDSRGSRPPARDQIKSARQRARQMRSRVHDRRKHARAGAEKQPGIGLILVTLVVVGGLLGAAVLITTGARRASSTWQAIASNSDVSGGPYAAGSTATDLGLRRAVLLINEHPQTDLPAVQARIDEEINRRTNQGYNVITTEATDNAIVLEAFELYKNDPHGQGDVLIEDAMEFRNLYGVLHVFRRDGYGRPENLIGTTLLTSTRNGATDRQYITEEMMVNIIGDAPTSLPLLFVNDHPARFSDDIQAAIDSTASDYAKQGWNLRKSTDAEADVRRYLPVGHIEISSDIRPQLARILADHGFAGVFRISSSNADVSTPDSIQIETLIFEEIVDDGDGTVRFTGNSE